MTATTTANTTHARSAWYDPTPDVRCIRRFVKAARRNNALAAEAAPLIVAWLDAGRPAGEYPNVPRIRPISKTTKWRAYDAGYRVATATGRDVPHSLDALAALVGL